MTSCVKTEEIDYEAEEQEKINQFLVYNGFQVTPTESGLYYIEIEEGTGPLPADGDTVVLDYVLKNIYGQVIETSIEELAMDYGIYNFNKIYIPVSFVIGNNDELPGVAEGVGYMRAGGKAVLVLPSKLAYKNHEPFVFDIWLLEIRPADGE